MPDGVDTAMNAMEPPGRQAAMNGGWGEADAPELIATDHAVLLGRQAYHQGVRSAFVDFLPHVRA
jgi:hypothetical protein